MAYCINCGKETDWTSKSGYCKECAEAELKRENQAPIVGNIPPQTAPEPAVAQPSPFNGWMIAALIGCMIGFVCLVDIGIFGGFSFVGGDAYNMIITGIVALCWFLFSIFCAVIGAAVKITNVNKHN